ncbi:MAG: ABC transporter ATP-binding protein [Nocardioides sp.]|nr:ABC transporter ATP-binding protein [Nocardioides sp.]
MPVTNAKGADTLSAGRRASQDPAIRFVDVEQRFTPPNRPAFNALQEITFDIADSEFCSIVGPSGCGKSTLLNMAAGLLRQTSGEVQALGKRVEAVNTDVGYVTQDSNLLPWMTVEKNIELPLKIRGYAKADRARLVSEWIELVGLEGFETSYPHQLSGGMQKRCAIARTLVYDPEVVLLDEPFGAVDAITRTVLQGVLLDLWSSKRKSVLFVTHDLNEAITLSDKVVVMTRRPGTVKAIVPVDLPRPRDVYEIAEHPRFAELHKELWSLFKSEI